MLSTSPTLVQVTDLHLSRDFPFFLMNWEVLAERIRDIAPDLVLVTGDLGLSDPQRESDLVFARQKLDELGLPWLAIAGNHDIGEVPHPNHVGGVDGMVTSENCRRFEHYFGAGCFAQRLGKWLILGVNAQLFGSGLPEESEQRSKIETLLSGYTGDSVILAIHKPLYCPEQGADKPGWSIPQQESIWLDAQLQRFPKRSILSGHLHRHKRYWQRRTDCIWGPSTAFFASHPRIASRGGLLQVGALKLHLGDSAIDVHLIDDDRLLNHDARNWFNPGSNALARLLSQPSPFGR